MREALFRYYVDLGHSLCRERAYYISTRRINNVYSGFLLLASAGGIVTLSIWDAVPVLWASIAILAQVCQVLQPLLQSSKQHSALKYIIQDKQALFEEVCAYWNEIGAYEMPSEQESEAHSKIIEWKQRERAIYNRFAADLDFPLKKRIESKAKEMNRCYFWYNYDVDIKEELKDE